MYYTNFTGYNSELFLQIKRSIFIKFKFSFLLSGNSEFFHFRPEMFHLFHMVINAEN